ncbi:hypothetical protein M1271_02160 [Patescibacteria group bacterium]|nr:hypothetical protein [Patescibacteria group bacterium]MCL5798337.1 hypothetical protein [Patescibacteria group bacterium]
MRTKVLFALFFLICVFLFLRFYHIGSSFNFGADQGLGLLEDYKIYQTKKISLIGETGNSWSSGGRYFFNSSLLSYMMIPILLLSHWDPFVTAYFLISLQFLGLVAVYWILAVNQRRFITAFIFAVLYTFFPLMVEHSRFFWSPSFLIPVSTAVLAINLLVGKKGDKKIIFLLGFLWGVGLQMHYSFILALAVSFAWVFSKIRAKKEIFIFALAGFIIGFSPIIIFELRHSFYNLRTLLLVLSVNASGESGQTIRLNYHYVLSLLPFAFYLLALIIVKITQRYMWTGFALIIIFIYCSLLLILPTPTHGFTMVEGWNYAGVSKTEKIIADENKEDFNLVDLLTGDTRAMALRYLLTVNNHPPLSISDYKIAKFLYVYSRVPIKQILGGSLWEIDSARPLKLEKSWHIQNGIQLYLLGKSSSPTR